MKMLCKVARGLALLGPLACSPAQSALVYDRVVPNSGQIVAPTDVVQV